MRLTGKKIFPVRVGAENEVRFKTAFAPLFKQIVPLYSTVLLNCAVEVQDIQDPTGLVESMNKRVPGASWEPAVPGLYLKQVWGGGFMGAKGNSKKNVCGNMS